MRSAISLYRARRHSDSIQGARPLFSSAAPALLLAVLASSHCEIGAAGPSRPEQADDQRTTAALSSPKASAATTRADLDGGPIYSSRCAACHQSSGTGLSGVFPPLAGSEWVNGDEAILIQIVLHGVRGALTVRGERYNMSMPGLGSQMSDEEIAAVATYVRSQWGNKASAVAPDTVKRKRAASAARTSAYTEAELAKLPR